MSETPMPAAPFKDRRAGLIAFGIVELLMGGCCGLMLPLSVLNVFMMRSLPSAQQVQQPLSAVIFAAVLYTLASAFFIAMGVGSIRARRWARTLMLVFSWVWLATGVLTLAILPTMYTGLRQQMAETPGADASVVTGVLIFMAVVFIVGYLLLPGAFVLFYRSPHVKATVEHRDPNVPWTDRRPAPVLAASLLLGLGAAAMLATTFAYGAVALFGLHRGVAAYAIALPIAAIYAFAGVELYQERLRGWWVALVASVVLTICGLVTFLHLDFAALYEAVGYGPEMARQMAPIGESMRWVFVLWLPVWIGFLLWVKRYLPGNGSQGAPSADAPER